MGKKSLVLTVLITIFFISFASATEPALYIPSQQNSNIFLQVLNEDNSPATASTNCTFTIRDETQTMVMDESSMTFNTGGKYNISIPSSLVNETGDYPANLKCNNGVDYLSTDFVIGVNPQGLRPSNERSDAQGRGIWALFLIGLAFLITAFILNINTPAKLTIGVFGIIFLAAGLNVVFINMRNEAVSSDLVNLFDGLSAVSFYFIWFAAGFLILMWIFTFFNTWLYKKNMNRLNKIKGFEG